LTSDLSLARFASLRDIPGLMRRREQNVIDLTLN